MRALDINEFAMVSGGKTTYATKPKTEQGGGRGQDSCGVQALEAWAKGSVSGAVEGGIVGGITGAVMGGPGGALGGALLGGGIGGLGKGIVEGGDKLGECYGAW